MQKNKQDIEWPTVGLWLAVVSVWVLALWVVAGWSWALGLCLLVPTLVLHASLTHEVIHGHPFPSKAWSQALVWVNPGLFVPFLRFRDTHLAHHIDARLTDPYEDPETNYLDSAVWERLPIWSRRLRSWNNTLLGRMLIGPVIGQCDFLRADWHAARSGDRVVLRAWCHHAAGCATVLGIVWFSPVPIWLYLLACYCAMSVLKIRTFLEHQAHESAAGRTVIIEARCPLAFLFLFNSLHLVHHMHPRLPWYALPEKFAQRRAHLLARQDSYHFPSYGAVVRAYLMRSKDPVPHPLWSSKT